MLNELLLKDLNEFINHNSGGIINVIAIINLVD